MEQTVKQGEGQGGHGSNEHEQGPYVMITVNNIPVRIHRGHRTIAEIKAAANVPLADDLEQIIDGKLTPLPDDGAVTLKGEEKFISHPKDGSST